jgi:hypothetical protein
MSPQILSLNNQDFKVVGLLAAELMALATFSFFRQSPNFKVLLCQTPKGRGYKPIYSAWHELITHKSKNLNIELNLNFI